MTNTTKGRALTRRDALGRAAKVGAVAWAAPVVLTGYTNGRNGPGGTPDPKQSPGARAKGCKQVCFQYCYDDWKQSEMTSNPWETHKFRGLDEIWCSTDRSSWTGVRRNGDGYWIYRGETLYIADKNPTGSGPRGGMPSQTDEATETVPPTTAAPETVPPTTVAPETVPPTTAAPETVPPTTVAPATTVAPVEVEAPVTTAPPVAEEPEQQVEQTTTTTTQPTEAVVATVPEEPPTIIATPVVMDEEAEVYLQKPAGFFKVVDLVQENEPG